MTGNKATTTMLLRIIRILKDESDIGITTINSRLLYHVDKNTMKDAMAFLEYCNIIEHHWKDSKKLYKIKEHRP
jgi:hypothetical protein